VDSFQQIESFFKNKYFIRCKYKQKVVIRDNPSQQWEMYEIRDKYSKKHGFFLRNDKKNIVTEEQSGGGVSLYVVFLLIFPSRPYLIGHVGYIRYKEQKESTTKTQQAYGLSWIPFAINFFVL